LQQVEEKETSVKKAKAAGNSKFRDKAK